jgi:hypothetical protein
MARFRKLILRCGKLQAGQTEVVTTPERLSRLARNFARMKNNEQVVPVAWDHAADLNTAVPLSHVDYRASLSAKNTVGKLHSCQLSPDKQSLELLIDIERDDAKEPVAKNLVAVSPVIFSHWQDGGGNRYVDCITHVDLVTHPVDHHQSAFEAVALSMHGQTIKIERLSIMAKDNENVDEGDEPKDAPEKVETPEVAEPPVPEQPSTDDGGIVTELIGALAKMKPPIVLSQDTNASNLARHLLQVVNSLNAAGAQSEPEKPAIDTLSPDRPAKPVQEAQPNMVGMSLDNPIYRIANTQYKSGIASRLEAAFNSGRLTPAEYQARKTEASAIALSLDSAQHPVKTDLEKFLESREVLPAGVLWDGEQRKTALSLSAAEPDAKLIGEPQDTKTIQEQMNKLTGSFMAK